ncbi:GH92 family glycosyl hydrolase [Maribacter sp. 2307ULW6-5]|uniref:GH92 family glycosyl hydrolase n=1 Tax=Maribacter sp. 2307ULW6-5 TaxID=3386275 RepID=UPI0039BC45D1
MRTHYQTTLFRLLPLWVALAVSCTEPPAKAVAAESLTTHVNPFIGTDGPGNTYPGATLPFGMVQLSPDIGIPGWDRIAGYYWPDSILSGFSHTHLSGTGAGDLYDILVMPTNGRFSQRIAANGHRPFSRYDHDREGASPGHYWVHLLDYGIKAELTATKRVGVHRYTFPRDTTSAIHVDLGYSLNWDRATDTHISVVNDSTIRGHRMSTGWARNQRLFFEMRLSKPFKHHTLTEQMVNGSRHAKISLHYTTGEQEAITVRTGLSSVSTEAAAKAIDQEALAPFDGLRNAADRIWEEQLKKVTITESDPDKKAVFYTMLYQSMLAPTLYSDIDGHYKTANDDQGAYLPGKDSVSRALGFERYDTFSLWDTFRAAHPLQTLIHPDKVPHFVRSLLAHYQETQVLPVWSMQGSETNIMIGYHAIPVIVDAYFKGYPFDAELAYEACKASAMVNDRQLDIYKEKGYIPTGEQDENWSVSKTMEYAFGDWCVAMFAKDLGKEEDHHYFLKRSENWKNLYNAQNSWIQPKDPAGVFLSPFVPKEYSAHFCESNAWHYYWFVPQDIPGLMAHTGGKARFEQKLDSMFTHAPAPEDKLPLFSTGMIGQYAHGNEPSHHVAYLYNYVNRPSKAQRRIRQILEGQYQNAPNGHCGNEDCGQMSSWYVLSALGLYPVNPAQGVYDLGIPLYEKAVVDVGNGKPLTIVAQGGVEKPFVKCVSLNGKTLNRSYVTHRELQAGGTLTFFMTDDAKEADERPLKSPETNKVYH